MSDPGDRQRRQAEQYRAFIEDDQHPRYPPYTSLHALPRSTAARDEPLRPRPQLWIGTPANPLLDGVLRRLTDDAKRSRTETTFGIDVATGQIASRDSDGRIRLARPQSSSTDIVADVIRWRELFLSQTTPIPTPKPRRANPESDTMTNITSTSTEQLVFDHDQEVRAKSLKVARDVVSSGGSLFGGAKPSEAFGTTDLLDLAEYVRGGVITTRISTADDTIIDRFDPANPDPTEEYIEEHIKTRAAFKKLADTVTAGRIPVPFENSFIVAIDGDAPDDGLIEAVKGARRALKQIVTERGLKL